VVPDRPSERDTDPVARSLPASRAMTVSIDFDRTFAADPALWGEFARQAVADGNTVVMISRRPESDREEVIASLGDYAESFSQVLLVGGDTLKADAADAAGIAVDVWVDDSPQTISPPMDCGCDSERGFCATGDGGGIDNSCPSGSGGGGPSPGGGVGDPSGSHSVKLPKDPKKLTVDQAKSAMKELGYDVGESVYSPSEKTTKVAITDSSGKSTSITTDKMKEVVYGNHSDPDVAKTKIPKPRKRSSDGGTV
jgi:hypothetical protein